MITNNYKNILIKFCIWLGVGVFLMFYGITHSLALTYTNIGEMRNVTQQLVSTNYGDAPYNNPVNSGYAFSDVLQVDYIISNYNFEANKNYQLESHLSSQQLTNANSYSVQGLNGESCLISYQNSIFQDAYPRWAFQCPHATNTITISIRNSSNEYLWSGTGIFNWQTALLKYSDTSLSGSGTDTDNIINNQNQNTQDIINNQNQNTQDIINNQNQNTQDILDSQQVCTSVQYDKNDIKTPNMYLNSSGVEKSTTGWGISDYIKFTGTITINAYSTNSAGSICYYNNSKTLISCETYSTVYNNQGLTIPSNSKYIRFSIQTSNNIPRFTINTCQNGNQALNDSINNLDDTLKDDSVDENGIADAFDDFNDFLDDNSTITQLITLPITLYTAILNNLNGTCQPFNLGKLYGEDLILPCINISQYLGNSLWSMIDIIISGFAVYAISKKMIKVFNNFSSLREGDVIDD